MSNRDLLEVSDGIDQLHCQFKTVVHGGCLLSSDEVTGLLDLLSVLRSRARKLENEVSRHRWNAAARGVEGQGAVVLEAVQEGNSNVVLFPPSERPFHDGSVA